MTWIQDTLLIPSDLKGRTRWGYGVLNLTTALLRDKFSVSERGVVEIKGKGSMITYWLNGKLNGSEPV